MILMKQYSLPVHFQFDILYNLLLIHITYNINDYNSNIKMSIAVHKHIIMYVHHNNMHMHVLCDIEFTRDQPPLFQ